MHYRRERLMIPMIVVSTLLVVAIGLLVYGFMIDIPELIKQKEKEIEAREETEKKLKQQVKDNIALEEFVGTKGAKDPSVTFKIEWVDDKGKPSLELMKDYLGKKDKNRLGEYKNFPEYIVALEDDFKTSITKLEIAQSNLNEKIRGLENDYKKLEDDKNTMQERYDKVDIPKLKEDYESKISGLEFDKQKAEDDLKAKKKLWETMEADYGKMAEDLRILKSEINEKEAQVESLGRRIKHLEGVVADFERGKVKEYTRKVIGEVVTVESGVDGILGSINIGTKDGLKQGIIFEVMHGDEIKGRIRIIQVNEETAIFQVVVMHKGADPIIAGDKISSPLFTPGERPEFVILGKFKSHDFPHSREDIEYLITEWGGKVVDEITANTRYVIVGDGVDEDELRTMGAYGIERINKARLKDFLETK